MRSDLAVAQHLPLARQSSWTGSLLLYAAFIGGTLLLFMDVVSSMVQTWWLTTAFNHCAFVPLASIFLAWRQRELLLELRPRRDWLGLALLTGFLVGWLVGRAADVMLFQQLALVGMFIALFVTIFGRRIAWQIAYPLGFLFLMVPFGEELIPWLQDFTAHFSVRMLRLLDVPVFHDGILLTTPSGLFEVAEACAGLRFLIANVVIALLFSHLAYRRVWKAAIFLGIAVIVPILANGLRAAAIIYIAYLTDNEYAVGVDHLVYGWVFFALIMVLLLLVGNSFADRPKDLERARIVDPGGVGHTPVFPLLGALLLLVAAPAYAVMVIEPPARVPMLNVPTSGLGGGWAKEPVGDWSPTFGKADLVLGSTYVDNGEEVEFFVGYYAFQRRGAELIQEANRLADGERWHRRRSGEHHLAIDNLPATVRLEELTTGDQRRRVVFSWYWVSGRFTASRAEALALQALDRLLGRSRPAAILAVAARYDDTPSEAIKSLERFLAEHPALQVYLESIKAVQPAAEGDAAEKSAQG
jgi:exosortase A